MSWLRHPRPVAADDFPPHVAERVAVDAEGIAYDPLDEWGYLTSARDKTRAWLMSRWERLTPDQREQTDAAIQTAEEAGTHEAFKVLRATVMTITRSILPTP